MDWLKDRPFAQMMLSFLLSMISMMILFWMTGFVNYKEKTKEEINKKADLSYVKEQDEITRSRIGRTESLFLEEIKMLREDLRLKQNKQ